MNNRLCSLLAHLFRYFNCNYLCFLNAAITPQRYTQPVFKNYASSCMEHDESMEQLSTEPLFKEAGAVGLSDFYFV